MNSVTGTSTAATDRFVEPRTPVVIDPTTDQFATPVPYTKGKGKGFLTLQPSKRAQALLVAAGLAVAS